MHNQLKALMAAIKQNDIEQVKQLATNEIINQFMRIPLRSGRRMTQTPLMFAAAISHVACVEVLIAKSADVNQATNSGFTPLYAAAISAKKHVVQCIELLINKTQKTFTQDALFMLATTPKHENFLQLLDHNLLDQAQTKKWQRVPTGQRKLKALNEEPHRIFPYFSVNEIKIYFPVLGGRYLSKIQALGATADQSLIQALALNPYTDIPFSTFSTFFNLKTKADAQSKKGYLNNISNGHSRI